MDNIENYYKWFAGIVTTVLIIIKRAFSFLNLLKEMEKNRKIADGKHSEQMNLLLQQNEITNIHLKDLADRFDRLAIRMDNAQLLYNARK